jgi:putative SOS response-associated peptidase YedK
LRLLAAGRRPTLARSASLGLVPWWAKNIKMGVRCINAMAETVAVKPAFRDAEMAVFFEGSVFGPRYSE